MELTTPSPTAKAPAAAFTGDVYLNPIKKTAEPSRLIASIVRFTPGARTNWHSHALGQTLLCTDGAGLVVSRDGTNIRIRPGDRVDAARRGTLARCRSRLHDGPPPNARRRRRR